MSPSPEPTAPAAEMPVEADILHRGEEIILAIKPSSWFVFLVSWPVVVASILVAVGAYLATEMFHADLRGRTVLVICIAVGCARIMLACFQWVGHLYLLTNLRVLRIRGVLRPDIFEVPLRRIRQTRLTAALPERALGLASLHFAGAEGELPQGIWRHIAHPEEVLGTVNEAVRRTRR